MYDPKQLEKDLSEALERINDICNRASREGFIVKYSNSPNPTTGQMETTLLEIYQRINSSVGKH